jgi:hypothetical protein
MVWSAKLCTVRISAPGPREATPPLNSICPYFTMFPLSFPLRVLSKGTPREWVLDPFCGRGTTNFAARLRGMRNVGIDSSPVAAAIARAKQAITDSGKAQHLIRAALSNDVSQDVPEGDFWQLAFDRSVLEDLCRLRTFLANAPNTPTKSFVIGVILGALHGPRGKTASTYFSNQSPRTFAPKPRYAVKYWTRLNLRPPKADVEDILLTRLRRALVRIPARTDGEVRQDDSRSDAAFDAMPGKFSWIITSPPYYGMRTYRQDQWLRNWFLGGPDGVSYGQAAEDLAHGSPEAFASQLRQVWLNCASVAQTTARLVIRFGSIGDRRQDPREILKLSLKDTPWKLRTAHNAGSASNGRRQATQFACAGASRVEYDFVAHLLT